MFNIYVLFDLVIYYKFYIMNIQKKKKTTKKLNLYSYFKEIDIFDKLLNFQIY